MSNITSVRFINAEQTLFEAVIDGKTYRTVAPQGAIYDLVQEHINNGFTPDPYVASAPPTPPTLDQIYDATIQTDKVLKAIVLAINDGSLAVGANKTGAQLKTIIKAKM